MDIKELYKTFLENSRSSEIFNDEIDSKHTRIIQNSKKNLENLNSTNFRNWSEQSDMGLKYKMTYFSKIFLGLKNIFFFNFLFELLKKRLNHIFEFSSMIDDIQIIKSLNGENLIKENPQNKTPGATNFPLVNGYSVTSRWLRYLYFLNQFKRFELLKNNQAWLDIGSYYGGLQGLVKKNFPDAIIIMLDFNHQLTRSYIYLKQMYPNSNHILPNKISNIKNLNDLPKGSILYVELEDLKKLNEFNINIVTNFFSLGEMKRNTFNNYLKSDFIKNCQTLYFVNRFNSSPFYDMTYDDPINIFDYKIKKDIFYFDHFPIHQYNVANRKVLERKFFRNASSSYFEIIWKKN